MSSGQFKLTLTANCVSGEPMATVAILAPTTTTGSTTFAFGPIPAVTNTHNDGARMSAEDDPESFSSMAKALRSKRELLSQVVKGPQEHKTSRANPQPSLFPQSVQLNEKAVIVRMKCPPLALLSHSTHGPPRLPSLSPQITSAPSSKDSLMLSAGAVRERSCTILTLNLTSGRYRALRKGEEKKASDRHSRILKRHSATMKSSFNTEVDPLKTAEEIEDEVFSEVLDEPSYPSGTTFLSNLSYTKVPPDLNLPI
jgi:hypothetical protein